MSETQKAKEYFEEGYGLYCMHKYDKAIDKLTKAIELDSNFAKAYFYRGECRLFSDPSIARKDYDKGIEFEPNNALAYFQRASTYVFYETLSEASQKQMESDFDMAQKLAPDLIEKEIKREKNETR